MKGKERSAKKQMDAEKSTYVAFQCRDCQKNWETITMLKQRGKLLSADVEFLQQVSIRALRRFP